MNSGPSANHSKFSVPDWMRAKMDDGQRFLALCILVGGLCGGAAVLFHKAIHHSFEGLWHFAEERSNWAFWLTLLLAPTLGGLVIGVATQHLNKRVKGSGIPQTKEAYYNRNGKIPISDAIWRFVLGTVYIGSGNSLGREGPTVHMASSIASNIGRWALRDPQRQRAMVPVGMAAGIAAAFNAPLSAITFVFEELLDNFSMKALGGIVIAVVLADAITRTTLGEAPVLQTSLQDQFSTAPWMFVALPLGLAAGLIGHSFTAAILKSRELFSLGSLRPELKPAIGGLCCGLLGIGALTLTSTFGQAQNTVFSIGYESLTLAFEENLFISSLAILLIFKFFAVVINYGSGGSGGLFAPTLFLGGMLGGLIGAGTIALDKLWIFDLTGEKQIMGGCVLLGMGAMFASVIRCPFTSLLIIFEMTGNYSLILPLMAGNMLSWGIASRLRKTSIYDALLAQDSVTLRKVPTYRDSRDFHNLPVSTIMSYQITTLKMEQTAHQALRLLKEIDADFHAYPVLNGDEELVGLVTRHELREALKDPSIAQIIADQKLVTVPPDTSIRQAARLMYRNDFRQLPVTDHLNPQKMLGLITLNDIVRQQNRSD